MLSPLTANPKLKASWTFFHEEKCLNNANNETNNILQCITNKYAMTQRDLWIIIYYTSNPDRQYVTLKSIRLSAVSKMEQN